MSCRTCGSGSPPDYLHPQSFHTTGRYEYLSLCGLARNRRYPWPHEPLASKIFQTIWTFEKLHWVWHKNDDSTLLDMDFTSTSSKRNGKLWNNWPVLTQHIFGRPLWSFPQNPGQTAILPVVAALYLIRFLIWGPPHLFAQKSKSTLMYVSNLLPCRLADSEYDLADISFSIGRYWHTSLIGNSLSF